MRAKTLSVFLLLLIASMGGPIQPVTAPPIGKYFDHIIIIAMENENYANVIGNAAAPFITSLAAQGSTIPQYHSYGATKPVTGCSAGCYAALVSGSDQGIANGYNCCVNSQYIIDQVQAAGLTWQAYCAEGCPRGHDHFPFADFASTSNSPNIFNTSAVTTANFVAAANSPNPPNFLWYTPTDSENMHDNSVASGDTYVKNFLVGSGSISTPGAGSLLASNLFTNPSMRTLLYLWWDEYDPSPNVEYGRMVKTGYTSSATNYDEYSSLHLMEENWGFTPLLNAAAAPVMSDLFAPPTLFTLTIASVTGGNTTPAAGSYSELAGSNVSVTAMPNAGFMFDKFTFDGHTLTTNPITIIMNSNHTLTASFDTVPPTTYTLTVNSEAGGTTNPAPGTYNETEGTNVTLTATPSNGFNFQGFRVDGVESSGSSINVTMAADHVITAAFTVKDWGEGGGGGVSSKPV